MPEIRRSAATIGLLICFAGCGKEAAGGVYPVRGRVLYNGRPVANAQVTLHPIDDGKRKAVRPVGRVNEHGEFTLTTFQAGDGAPAGDYRVTVVWYLATPARPGSEDTVSVNYLPAKYSSTETSGLAVTVTTGSNELRPFELK